MVTRIPHWKAELILFKPSKIEKWLLENNGTPCYLLSKYERYGVKFWVIKFSYHTSDNLRYGSWEEFFHWLRKKKLALCINHHPDGRPKAYIRYVNYGKKSKQRPRVKTVCEEYQAA